MASSGNFATINFQAQSKTSTVTPTLGNLKFDGSTLSPGNYNGGVVCNFGMKGGKWYWEIYLSGGGSPAGARDWSVGFAPYSTASKSVDDGTYGQDLGNGSSATLSGYSFTHVNGSATGIRHNGSTDTSAGLSDHTSGDVLGFALDLDNGTWIIYRNGSSLGTVATGIDTSLTYFPAVGASGGTVSNFDVTCNFGQDSTFGGAITAGGNADENGFGDFKYSVPSGYVACCTGNLEIASGIDPARTDDDYVGGKQFNVITLTGNGSSRTISGLGLQPDFIWAKRRDGSRRHYLVDSNRGFTKYLHAEGTYSEGTSSTGITSANSDGFVIGGGLDYINTNTHTYVAWCWRANGGTTVSNSEGSITATVQANTNAGFSIVTYTGGYGSWGSSYRSTFGHGLSQAPEFMIFKERDNTDAWTVFHHSVGNGGGSNPASNNLRLDNTDALYTNQSYKSFGGVMPTSTLVTVEGNTTNSSSNTHVAYIWHSVEGFSKFGSYTGNGNSSGASSPFIYTGFRPRFVITKGLSVSGWNLRDSERSPDNIVNEVLQADTESAEMTSNYDVLFFSNGFKILATAGDSNTDGNTYVYGAWGDVPFKYNNTF